MDVRVEVLRPKLKGVGLKEQKLAKFDNVSFLACKIRSFQNDNAIFVNRQEMTFFGAQKGLWGGRRGSEFLILHQTCVIIIFIKNCDVLSLEDYELLKKITKITNFIVKLQITAIFKYKIGIYTNKKLMFGFS